MFICSFLHDYIFLSNFPTYMFIQTYMIIYFLINFPTYTFIQAYTIINFWPLFLPTCLFRPTRLLIFDHFSHLHVY